VAAPCQQQQLSSYLHCLQALEIKPLSLQLLAEGDKGKKKPNDEKASFYFLHPSKGGN
jgi:hypothetical protein